MALKAKKHVARGVWSPKSLVVFALLFTVYPSLIMFALNYGRYGFPRKRAAWFFITGILFVLMMALDEISPGWSWHRTFILTAGSVWILYLKQIGLYRQWIASGKRTATIRSGLLACGLGLGVVIVLSIMAVLLTQKDNDAYELILNEQYGEAERVLVESRQKYPYDLDVRYDLAIVYANTERPEMARSELKAMLKIDPGNKDAKAFLKLLDIPEGNE